MFQRNFYRFSSARILCSMYYSKYQPDTGGVFLGGYGGLIQVANLCLNDPLEITSIIFVAKSLCWDFHEDRRFSL